VQAHPIAMTDRHLQTSISDFSIAGAINVVRVAARLAVARHFDDDLGALAEPLTGC
jgi:hypothetical protein